MKRIKYIFTLLTILTIISSCKHDPCKDTNCLHGGTCNNGTCECPVGYTGPDCGTEKTPASIKITQIALNSFPDLDNNGNDWDFAHVGDNPDVFLSINSGSIANDVQTTQVENEAFSGLTPYFRPVTALVLSNPANTYTIGVWDYDTTDPDDLMGTINFTPNNFKSGFPQSFNLSSGGISLTVDVVWNF